MGLVVKVLVVNLILWLRSVVRSNVVETFIDSRKEVSSQNMQAFLTTDCLLLEDFNLVILLEVSVNVFSTFTIKMLTEEGIVRYYSSTDITIKALFSCLKHN